jgi:predicted DNA-binding ribbon-helix-helix protein
MRLGPDFEDALREIAQLESRHIGEIVRKIDHARGELSLTHAVRVFILQYYMRMSETTRQVRQQSARRKAWSDR